MLTALVQSGILGIEGKEFARLERCPFCEGIVNGYDMNETRFAILQAE